MHSLAEQSLLRCDANSHSMPEAEVKQQLGSLNNWQAIIENNATQIMRVFTFKNFVNGLRFTNQIAELAEQEDHHPKICLEWGQVSVSWWTHTLSGLFINDFIMAARCDELYNSQP